MIVERKLTVLGNPMGKQRPRVTKWGTHTPEKTMNYEAVVRAAYNDQVGKGMLPGNVSMKIVAYYYIPKSTSKKRRALMVSGDIRPTKKPDVDNIGKIVSDSLNGIAYRDDSQIVNMLITKYYSDVPMVEITIRGEIDES